MERPRQTQSAHLFASPLTFVSVSREVCGARGAGECDCEFAADRVATQISSHWKVAQNGSLRSSNNISNSSRENAQLSADATRPAPSLAGRKQAEWPPESWPPFKFHSLRGKRMNRPNEQPPQGQESESQESPPAITRERERGHQDNKCLSPMRAPEPTAGAHRSCRDVIRIV